MSWLSTCTAVFLLLTLCNADADSATRWSSADVEKEQQKVQIVLEGAQEAMRKAVNDNILAEKDEALAEQEEKKAEKDEMLAEAKEQIAEKDERKVVKEGLAGHTNASASDELQVQQEELVAEQDEIAAEKEEMIAETDETKAWQELYKAKVEEKVTEGYAERAAKELKRAKDAGVHADVMHAFGVSEKMLQKQERQTRQQIARDQKAEEAENYAQEEERQADWEQDQVQNDERLAEQEAAAGMFTVAEQREALVESEEQIADNDEMTAEADEVKLGTKKVFRSQDKAVTKLYDMEGAAVAGARSGFKPSAGVIATGLAAVGLAIVGFRAMKPKRQRERDYISVQDDSDGYDSEAPAE